MNSNNPEISIIKNFSKSIIINLSNYQLQMIDYEQLSELIKESPYLEELIMPKILEQDFNQILELLNNANKKSVSLKQITLEIPAKSIENNKSRFNQINIRLSRNREKIYGIHGGGNFGLCLMAYEASNSPKGFEIVATTSKELMTRVINCTNKVYFQHKKPHERSVASKVFMICRHREPLLELYQEAVLLAICVTADVMHMITEDIAICLIQRYKKDQNFLKILVLMNQTNCADFAYEAVHKAMMHLTNEDLEYVEKVLASVEFVSTDIDRIVTMFPMKKSESKLQMI